MCAKRTFTKVEQLLREKIPGGLELILENAGYDTLNSLSSITEEDITEIENYTNKDKDILKKTTYPIPENGIFKFKPGHKKFLINIPAALKRNQKENCEPIRKQQKNSETNVNVEIEEIELKKQLVNKVVKFAAKFNVEIKFDVDLNTIISEYHIEGDKVKCKFNCPSCDLKYSCLYHRYWIISNFENHLKKHFVLLNTQLTESEKIKEKENQNSTSAPLQTSTHANNIQIVCFSDAQNNALNEILSDLE